MSKNEKPKIEPLESNELFTVELCAPIKDQLNSIKICAPNIEIKTCAPLSSPRCLPFFYKMESCLPRVSCAPLVPMGCLPIVTRMETGCLPSHTSGLNLEDLYAKIDRLTKEINELKSKIK